VTYSNGKPTGYGEPCVGSEDADSFKTVWNMMEKAMQLPPLQEEDFEKAEGYTFEDLFNEQTKGEVNVTKPSPSVSCTVRYAVSGVNDTIPHKPTFSKIDVT
jgi:hypothetical protein